MTELQTTTKTDGAAPTRSNGGGGEGLLSVRNLKKYFPIRRGVLIERTADYVKAVDDVSFDVYAGQTLRLGQEHDGLLRAAAPQAHRRVRDVRRQGTDDDEPQGTARDAPRDPDRLPG